MLSICSFPWNLAADYTTFSGTPCIGGTCLRTRRGVPREKENGTTSPFVPL